MAVQFEELQIGSRSFHTPDCCQRGTAGVFRRYGGDAIQMNAVEGAMHRETLLA